MNPSVSIVITTYNQGRFIEQTVLSALNQRYVDREVVVVDDGSTDDTPERLRKFGDQIVYVRQANQGVANSRNTGVRVARGELIAFLDGDDLWDPEKIAIQVATYEKYPHAGAVVTDSCVFDGDQELHASTLLWRRSFRESPAGSSFSGRADRSLLSGNFIMTTSQVMVPAKILRETGPSDSQFPIASDYDLYLRIANKYELTFIRQSLAKWRYLPTSASGPSALRPLRCGHDEIRVLKKHLGLVDRELRPIVLDTLRRKTYQAARRVYDYGCDVDNAWAVKYLPSLWANNRSNLWPLVYWAALQCPPQIRELIKFPFKRIIASQRTKYSDAV